jgi:hypothetical protein
MLISTALLLDSIIRNSVCTPAKLPCRRVEVGYIANDLIFNSPRDLARFKALQCRESGFWLHAIPSNIGTLLDNTSFQVCIGLRLGCNLCTPHICKCNAKVDEIGTHGLSCFKISGRFSRHTEINAIINWSLTSIHVNSTLEPNGLSRDDGKRPDGMTLVPWIKGQPLVWDVTVVDTLTDSYVLKSSEVSGFAAEMACKRKHSKKPSISLMSSETDLSRNQAIQNQRNSISRGFPLPFNVETLQAFGALFQIPQYYRKFLYYKTKMFM